MKAANIYLNFPGNTEVAFNFYKSVFGGEFTELHRFKDTPVAGRVAVADANKIMHVALPLTPTMTLMASDSLESMGQKTVMGNNFYISLHVESEREVEQFFAQLSVGGVVEMPVDKTFWGSYWGVLKDKFGIQWMISYEYPVTK